MANDQTVLKDKVLSSVKDKFQNLHSPADIVYLLSRIGILIETENKHSEFPVIWLYRNWCLHDQISNISSPRTLRLLKNSLRNTTELKERIPLESILMEELQSLSTNYRIDEMNIDQFEVFVNLLRNEIIEIPCLIAEPDPSFYVLTLKDESYELHANVAKDLSYAIIPKGKT